MVYRERAQDIAGATRNDDPDQSLLQLAALGPRGRDGADGHDGADGTGYGRDGQDGGHAGPAERGGDGGRIEIRLGRRGDGVVELSGTRGDASGRGVEVREAVEMGDRGYLDLVGRGGDGGHGGDGGSGGDGATGSSGSDATRVSSGSDGGAGGDGGDGGWASSGADGGHGGHIRVQVSEHDTPLLMLLRADTRGGAGGAPGRNGPAGSGGSGGRGGSSYSWTETEHYTDAQGNSQTRTTMHSNSGGSRGPSGSSGSAGNAAVHHGNQGKPGSFAITVSGPDGEHGYPSCFDLKLTGFRHRSDNADGIYEPGERIHVLDLEVENTGGMPTPAHHDIELTLQKLGWVVPEDEKLVLPRSLPPGRRHKFQEAEALHFHVGEYEPRGPEDPLACPEVIRHGATLPDVRRAFRQYEGRVSEEAGSFVISFPIQSSRLASLTSLAPGEAAKIHWSLTNRSGLPFGRQSESRRRVCFRLHSRYSELTDSHAALLDQAGQRVPLDTGWRVEIDLIEPGREMAFEATIGLLDDAPHYRRLGLWLTLEIGRIDDPDCLRTAQIAGLDVRVAQRYQPHADSELLVVVNHRTRREELDAWRALCDELGLGVDVWDLSLEGQLDLSRDLGGGRTLHDELMGKTVLLLNNLVERPNGKQVSASRFADKEQLLDAAAAGIGVATVGRGLDMERLLMPTRDRAPASALVASSATEASGTELAVGPFLAALDQPDQAAPTVHRLDVVKWSLLGGGTDPSDLRAAARKLARVLAARYPGQRYLVVQEEDPLLTRTLLWMKRWRVGTLELRRMLPVHAGPLLVASVEEDALHDPHFVRSDDALMLMWLTRSFDDKLQRLDELLSATNDEEAEGRRSDAVGMLLEAMLVDLAAEQMALLEVRSRSGLSGERMRSALPMLHQLAAFRPTRPRRIAPDSAIGKHLLRAIARLRHSSSARCGLLEWLPPWLWWRRAPRLHLLTKKLTAGLLRALIGGTGQLDDLGKSDWRGAKKALVSEAREIDEAWKLYVNEQQAEHGFVPSRADFADQLLMAPVRKRGITTAVEVFGHWSDRIVERAQMAAAEAHDDKQRKRRAKLMAGAQRAAANLKRTETTAQLLG